MTWRHLTNVSQWTAWSLVGYHSGDSEWVQWLLLGIQLLVIGQIFRAWIGPCVLRTVSKRVQVRRISLRSVRGVYVRLASMTIRIDRVGISYHPSAEAMRRFSLKVEGLWLEIHELKSHSRPRPRQSLSRRLSRLPTLADLRPSPMSWRFWSMYSAIYASLEPFVRPVIRSFFITITRVGIRCLPLLTQVVDFELDRALFTFTALPEAHVTVRGITLSACVAFSNLESVVGTTAEYPRNRIHRRFLSVAHFRTRFAGSFKRVWSHAWGRTQGSASFSVKIQKVSGFSSLSQWAQLNPEAASSPRNACASRFAFVTHSSHSRDMCFDLQDSAELVISFDVGQTKRIIRDHSISSSLKLPSIQFFATQFSTLLSAISTAKQSPARSDTVGDNLIVQHRRSVLFKDGRSDRRRPQLSMASLLRCIDVSLKDISIHHVIYGPNAAEPQSFTGHIRSVSVCFEFGEPEKVSLHKDFLGSRSDRAPDFDTEILSCHALAKEVTVRRENAVENVPPSRVISIRSIHLQGFATQWALLNMPVPPVFRGDPNASLLAIKLNVLAPQLSERVDIVADILDQVLKARTGPSTPREPLRVVRFIPRIMIDIAVDDVAACLTPVERNGAPSAPLIVSSTQCVISVSTSFSFFPPARSSISELQEPGSIPLEVSFSIRSLLGPAFIMLLPKPFSLDTSLGESVDSTGATGIGDRLLSLSAIELTASGHSLGVLFGDEVAVDVASTVTDVKCVTDAISLELWQPSAISSLITLLYSRADLEKPSPRKESSFLDKLPGNVTAHIAVEKLGVIITGKDINPNEDLGLSRGIAIRTGLALQLCTAHDRENYTRFPRRLTQAHDRQRLNLSEELLFDAISISGASPEQTAKFALLRCEMWDAVIRTSVATEFDADQTYGAEEEIEELKPTEFVWVRHVEINALSRCLSVADDHNKPVEQLQLSVKIPNVRAHLQLFHVYCGLLALRTLRSLIRSQQNSQSQPPRNVNADLKISITTFQLLLSLPLKEQVCFRVNGFRLRGSRKRDMSVEWGNLFAWIPSVIEREEGKWEELARLRSWKLSYDRRVDERSAFSVSGEGGRLRIPHGYVIADFILDANVFFKGVKHLVKIVSTGAFHPVPAPDAEDAKIIPTINLKIGCISLEASDDPFESRLGLIWRAGFEAARSRLDREEAFQDKVATIKAAEAQQMGLFDRETRFSPQHTVSIEEARERLLLVHSLSWLALHREYRDRQRRNEVTVRKEIRGEHSNLPGFDIDPLVPLAQSSKTPPLLRFITSKLNLTISPPSFPIHDLPGFLHDLGKGLPLDSRFTLLIPLHLRITMGSTCITLRDYPLPLVNIVQESLLDAEAWVVDTDFVVAEEVGSESSVVWRECPVVLEGSNGIGSKSLTLSVPKTTMPVKTYANPTVDVKTTRVTEFCWCNSYAPALQDVMSVIDTLTTPPPDPSPHVGFWDKMRLVLHWRVGFNFSSNVHLNLKGSRDPYATDGAGAGFAFCWNGNTRMTVGKANPENEVLQVCSDTMLVVIPEFSKRSTDEVAREGIPSHFDRATISLNQGLEGRRNSYKKICAKFSSGIKWGIGIVLERKCGRACLDCGGASSCRLFDFRPHYEVILEPKLEIPSENTPEDSYDRFRSDFIHFSTSLSSLGNDKTPLEKPSSSSFHLTPKTFAHFWSWWGLFDRYLSLPIRQGKLFPNARPPSKKFGRHLATIKYRIGVQQLFISHFYMDDTRESWSEGVTHCVGVKALVKSFEADMHQREQEAVVPGVAPNKAKKIRHKPFYAAEVKLADLQLCAVLATFTDPSKRLLDLRGVPKESKYKDVQPDVANELLRDFWFDMDDFVETDWEPTEDDPPAYFFPVASCPRFTYFKRASKQPHRGSTVESSRFGNEDSHVCLMGKEESVQSLQADIVGRRVSELREHLAYLRNPSVRDGRHADSDSEAQQVEKKIRQLERHISQLREAETPKTRQDNERTGEFAKYLMPSDISFPIDWTEFDNVYQAHCPKFSLCNSTRDVLMQYYYCSRARRGIEYHMATRAVKYIRDQINSNLRLSSDTDISKKTKNPTGLAAQAAAHALRKILAHHDSDGKPSQETQVLDTADDDQFDPMAGWSEETVSRNKSHFCLLLKPQVVLRSETTKDSMLVLATLQATLQSHTILDVAHIDDPISGRVMTRTHTVLTGLQAFSPSATCRSRYDGVPLEVLLDLRAESSEFDRLVPQTNATFRYDKFNRLRLRNNVTSAVPNPVDQSNNHLQHQTDLIRIHMPRFTVSANSKNFESIANVITTLLLRSDAVYKTHLSKVETLLFSYDFTDLSAVADVVENIQFRLRRSIEHEHDLENLVMSDDEGRADLMKMKAHIFLLSEELNLIFEAINLAQQKADDKHNDTKMALKVNASAQEISWGMVDSAGEMIAKLAVRGVEHNWLNRQDGSTVNNLLIADLQAFDGSRDAEWPEILTKHSEPASHPLVKRGIFMEADWTVLAPVGGITIFERFILDLHPIRLQLEARIGKSIMEYVWPARRDRRRLQSTSHVPEDQDARTESFFHHTTGHQHPFANRRQSTDDASPFHHKKRFSAEGARPTLRPTSRRITSSRSFTDLRAVSRQNSMNSEASISPNYLMANKSVSEFPFNEIDRRVSDSSPANPPLETGTGDDAAEMKTRSAQKTFVLVRISSIHVLLSFHKDGSFFCRDARIHTRELQYHNQTWSFEELAEQFIPSDTSWRGWMRMALHQPLVPVLPVAREIISKTKWKTGKSKAVRQARKIVKPRSTQATPRNSEQSSTSGSPSAIMNPPNGRKLRRPKGSIETPPTDDDGNIDLSSD